MRTCLSGWFMQAAARSSGLSWSAHYLSKARCIMWAVSRNWKSCAACLDGFA